VYSPFLRETTPRVSSSNSRSAHRKGLNISLRLHPPVTKIQSLKRQSLTVRNRGFPSIKLTGIAIALYFFIAHSQVIIRRYVYSSSFTSLFSGSSSVSGTDGSSGGALRCLTTWAEKFLNPSISFLVLFNSLKRKTSATAHTMVATIKSVSFVTGIIYK